MTYHYNVLKPARAPGSETHNAGLLGPDTLGVEVTEPALAARCGLGNIDPQHLGGDAATAAIEAALEVPLPPPGAQLVTIRPDADAYGAMAILTMRAEGREISVQARNRIALVGRSDRFDHGAWPGPRDLPQTVDEIDEVGPGPQGLGAMIGGIALATTPEAGVRAMIDWIDGAAVPPAWAARAASAAADLFGALTRGTVVVRDARPGRVAVVSGVAPGSLRLGYRRAPVIVAVGELRRGAGASAQRKVTIAQHGEGWVDLRRAAHLLAAEEPGWGGSSTIIGSPQGVSSTMPVERCIAVLQNCERSDHIATIADIRLPGGADDASR